MSCLDPAPGMSPLMVALVVGVCCLGLAFYGAAVTAFCRMVAERERARRAGGGR